MAGKKNSNKKKISGEFEVGALVRVKKPFTAIRNDGDTRNLTPMDDYIVRRVFDDQLVIIKKDWMENNDEADEPYSFVVDAKAVYAYPVAVVKQSEKVKEEAKEPVEYIQKSERPAIVREASNKAKLEGLGGVFLTVTGVACVIGFICNAFDSWGSLEALAPTQCLALVFGTVAIVVGLIALSIWGLCTLIGGE